MVEHLTTYDPVALQARDGLIAVGLAPDRAIGVLDRLVTGQALVLAANEFFWLSGFLYLLLIAAVWLARKPARAVAATAGEH